ncbi:uncharacterized protein LOC135345370 [Halichondria panicea]|uniref:uncharacterized protein LOC135345370 n=1 Tax=Halichondria panicea TaxID=6063 RepID=UPI00312B5439
MASPPNINQLTEEQILHEIEALQNQPFPFTEEQTYRLILLYSNRIEAVQSQPFPLTEKQTSELNLFSNEIEALKNQFPLTQTEQTYRSNLLSNENQLLTEKQVVDEIKYLRKRPFHLNKQKVDRRLNLLEQLHEKGKGVGYTTMKFKQDGQIKYKYGTVFHYGKNVLCTCSHVVEKEKQLGRMSVTFKWLDLESEEPQNNPVIRTYPPPQCDCSLSCEHSHRKGIYTKITQHGDVDVDESDLAMFREDQMNADPQLPSIQSHYGVAEDGKFYHIFFWDLQKIFHISNAPTQTTLDKYSVGKKDIGSSSFPFESPAPKGASGSPVMVYEKFEQNSKQKFCLAGVMKEGWEGIQCAESTESLCDLKEALGGLIEQHDKYKEMHEMWSILNQMALRMSVGRLRMALRPNILETRTRLQTRFQDMKYMEYTIVLNTYMQDMQDMMEFIREFYIDTEDVPDNVLTVKREFTTDYAIMKNLLRWLNGEIKCACTYILTFYQGTGPLSDLNYLV